MSNENGTSLNTPPPLMKQRNVIELPPGGTPDPALFPDETPYTERDDVLMECDEDIVDKDILSSSQYADRGDNYDGNFSPLASPDLSGLPDVSSQLSIFPDESPTASQEVELYTTNFLGFSPMPLKRDMDGLGTDIRSIGSYGVGGDSSVSLVTGDGNGGDNAMCQ